MSSTLEVAQKYVLGLDLGSASLGWALIALDDADNPVSLLRAGVRIFEPGVDGTSMDIEQGKDQSKAVERRTARLHRRQLRRRAARQRDLFRLLQRHSLLPTPEAIIGSPEEQRHTILNGLDQQLTDKWQSAFPDNRFAQLPLYFLRKTALDQPLETHEIGRILFHLIQRRGFLSNRRENKQNPDQKKELGQVKAEIHSLEQEIQNAGARTLGEFFAGLDPHAQRVRRRWTARRMFQDEFEKIWAIQANHRPDLLTGELHDKIAHFLFFQRPIAAQAHLIGKCELEPGKQRAPWAAMEAQRFRILQKVNDLRLINPGSLISNPLSDEERRRLYELLDREGDQTFKAIKKYLSFLPEVQFNLEKGDEKRLRGNRTQAVMRKVFADRWDSIGAGKQHQIIENWRNSESDEVLIREAIEQWSLDAAGATLLSEQTPEPGYCAVSLAAISKLLPLMACGKSFKEAETELYGARFSGGVVFETLPEVRKQLESLRNPAVERSLTELRKVMNAIVREYGKPYEIRIELARELKKPRQERIEATKKNRNHQREREDVAVRILRECGLSNPSRKDIEKARLHEECGGYCPYTGRHIPFSNLFDNSEFDVEHIIPRSRYPDDSFQNKTLCYLPENRDVKKGQTPWEAYGKDEQRWAEIMTRVSSWKNRGKMARFAIQTEEALGAFSARQMNDTRYASVLASRFLGTLYGGRDVADGEKVRQVIFASSGAVTATLRSSWGLEAILREIVPAELGESRGKPRTDHRHSQLVIELVQSEQLSLPFTTPISEIAVLLLAHPQVILSQAVLSRIAEVGGSVVTIDGKFLPASMQLPVQAHFLQTERFAKQMKISLPTQKRLWQEIVRAKIRAQGELLKELRGKDGGLIAMAARVRSDDAGNLEAQAARGYWSQIFNDPKFRRGSEEPNQNRHLDYGYTVLRAAVARALCAAGLHPSIGLRHKNRYDAFCLAADVMEPFRPLIDRRVSRWIVDHDPGEPLTTATKSWLIGATTSRYVFEREERSLFDILLRTANSLAKCVTGESREIAIPSLLEPCREPEVRRKGPQSVRFQEEIETVG